ncbi:hypothetical protein [Microbacterium sp. cx-59]|uniref:hypothetical protein n=1 Tax=Microbacterium sp. cx-59 TaxID=2891207 RepID=UPI001E5EB007|nr:hypothetical protein [Microbacterium sp. cx-59]MCC4908987.1 hypothetical protein [Microbacterium sp. cx-59]
MTLTSILPTLRDSIPAPLDDSVWPVHTRATTDDVVVAGVSVRRIAEICATPCVYTGAAVLPHSGGHASPTDSTTIVIARVTGVSGAGIVLDATFHGHAPLWREARLLGRVSHAYELRMPIAGADSPSPLGVVRLPDDVRAGDLIAVPCPGCFSVGDVRPARNR